MNWFTKRTGEGFRTQFSTDRSTDGIDLFIYHLSFKNVTNFNNHYFYDYL